MSSSSCLDIEPVFEPNPGRTTKWVNIIFFLATLRLKTKRPISLDSKDSVGKKKKRKVISQKDRVYLSNSLFYRGFGYKAVDHHLLVLTNPVSSAKGLQRENNKIVKIKWEKKKSENEDNKPNKI